MAIDDQTAITAITVVDDAVEIVAEGSWAQLTDSAEHPALGVSLRGSAWMPYGRELVASSRQVRRYGNRTGRRVVADRFASHDVPSTLLGLTVLGYPDHLVQIEAVAALPPDPSTT